MFKLSIPRKNTLFHYGSDFGNESFEHANANDSHRHRMITSAMVLRMMLPTNGNAVIESQTALELCSESINRLTQISR